MKAVLFIILLSIWYAIQVDSEELEASSCLYRYQGLVWNIGDLIRENDYLIDDTKDSKTKVYFNVCKKVTNKWTQDSYATLYQGDKWRSLTTKNIIKQG